MPRDDEHDYTRETAPGIDDFEIAEVSMGKDADQLESENSFEAIAVGDGQLLEVAGFVAAPKAEYVSCFLRGEPASYSTHSVLVKLAKVGEPRQQVTDYLLLPPGDPRELEAYNYGTKEPGGKNPGFMAGKFGHFIGRLGWPYPAGGKLPAEARRLSNWRGRQIVADIVPGKSYLDQKTGEEKPGRNQVRLYSYRAAGDSPAAGQGAKAKAAAPNGSGGSAKPAQPAPPRKQAANVGLDDL